MNNHFIPYGRQHIDEDDIQAVVATLKSDYLTCGTQVDAFEEALAAKVGAKYAVVVSNGTVALHIAYLAAGLQAGDEIITTPLTFAATANAALYAGATPKFADIDATTGNIFPYAIEALISNNSKIIAPVHYGGQPVELEQIHKIAKKHNLMVVEDACHALGAEYHDSKIGDCKYSDMTVFSFHPVKHITTGEGGAVTTNDKKLYETLKSLRAHGITTDPAESWRKSMTMLGYNYRLTDIQCALGVSQLKKLDNFVDRRREIAARYDNLLHGSQNLTLLSTIEQAKHSYHLYPILLDKSVDRAIFIDEMKRKGIGVQVHYGLVHKHPYYVSMGYTANTPIAEDFAARVVSLPIFPDLTEKEQNYVVDNIWIALLP